MALACDFCLAPDPRWSFPAPDLPLAEFEGTLHISEGGWAACTRCAGLVGRRQIDALVKAVMRDGVARMFGPAAVALPDTVLLKHQARLRGMYETLIPTLGPREVLKPQPGDGQKTILPHISGPPDLN